MKKVTMALLLIVNLEVMWGQDLSPAEFHKMPLEKKIDIFFNTFRVGYNHDGASRFASYIVSDHGYAVMPYIKERLKDADFFQYTPNQENILDLNLIAYIMVYLQYNSGNSFLNNGVPMYVITDEKTQWFVDEYIRRIEKYILIKRLIDAVVMTSDTLLIGIAAVGNYKKIVKYGYLYHGDKPVKYCGKELKRYYEERLGITDLKVVPPFIE